MSIAIFIGLFSCGLVHGFGQDLVGIETSALVECLSEGIDETATKVCRAYFAWPESTADLIACVEGNQRGRYDFAQNEAGETHLAGVEMNCQSGRHLYLQFTEDATSGSLKIRWVGEVID